MLIRNISKIRIMLIIVLTCALAAVLVFSRDTIIGVARTVEHELPLSRIDMRWREFSSHLPLMVIQSDIQAVYDRHSSKAVIWVFDNGAENRLTDVATTVFEAATARARGNTSYAFPKKPLAVKFYDPLLWKPMDYALLGFAPASEWVLHSPYIDKSLLRNWFAYELAATVLDWQPRGTPVQLFLQDGISGMIVYEGVYLLCEKITPGKARLDIGQFDLSDSDTIDFEGGGYVFQKDRVTYNYFFTMPNDSDCHIRYSYPVRDDITVRQNEALRSEIEFVFGLITRTGKYDGASGDDWNYQNYIEADSFIDYFLVGEMVRSLDTGVLSTYMYRPVGRKLNMGPLWDCDLSMGNSDYAYTDYYGFMNIESPIISSLLDDEEFSIRFVNRWYELRDSIWSDEEVFGLFDEMTEYLRAPAAQNAMRWPEVYDGKTYIWPNPKPHTASWEEEIERTRLWLVNRLRWMDEHMHRLVYETATDIGDG